MSLMDVLACQELEFSTAALPREADLTCSTSGEKVPLLVEQMAWPSYCWDGRRGKRAEF